MSDIDKTTGLPKLPEGFVWEVRRVYQYEESWGRKLVVGVSKVHGSGIYIYTDNSIAKTDVKAYGSTSSIRRAAAKSLRKFNKSRAKRARENGLDEFVGTYPPKKLED